MDTPKKYVCFEETIKGSRFLSELFLCQNQTQARDLLKSQKTKYADATHVVHAFITGNSGEIMGMSDDGEPSGTAGRPVLDVLKGRNCTNTMLTVTRWFGGTLLGTGGLVKAYSSGAKQVIARADEENAFEPLIEQAFFEFNVEYSLHKLIKISLSKYTISDLTETFETTVKINGKVKKEEFPVLKEELSNLSNGKIVLD